MPGGGIAPLLLNSPTFGPTIQMSVLTSGSAALKAAFTAYAPNCKTAVPTCFVNEFLPSLDAPPRPRRPAPAELQLRGPVGAGFG
jgi:triacylglycerol lipase